MLGARARACAHEDAREEEEAEALRDAREYGPQRPHAQAQACTHSEAKTLVNMLYAWYQWASHWCYGPRGEALDEVGCMPGSGVQPRAVWAGKSLAPTRRKELTWLHSSVKTTQETMRPTMNMAGSRPSCV